LIASVDSSVLIFLGKLGYLGLLPRVIEEVLIPEAVFEEVSRGGTVAGLRELISGGYLKVVSVSDKCVDVIGLNLGLGEAEAIILGLDRDVDLVLLDDLRARRTALRMGLEVMGTLGLVKMLLELGLIEEEPGKICDALIRHGFWVEFDLCAKILGLDDV